MGSRSTYTTASHAQPDSDENFGKSNISEKNENVNDNMELADTKLEGQEKEQVAKEKGKGLKLEDGETKAESMADVCGLRDLDAERDLEITPPLGSDHDNESTNNHLQLPEDPSTNLPQNRVSAPPGVDQTVEQERSKLESNRWRVVFNVLLALVLVTKWAYVNLQCLLSTGVDDSSRMHLVQSESMMWPFLLLQLCFVCVTSFQKTSHSPFISMLTVALQLCGIPIKFTHKLNFILTALLAAFKDFVVFLFSVIVIHDAVEYCIKSGLIKQGLEY